MKKVLVAVLAMLLLSSNAFAKELKIYHKDENIIRIQFSMWYHRQARIAAKHCAQYQKFAYKFYSEEGEGLLYHCSSKNLTISPTSGGKIYWTNYDPNHEFTDKEKEDKKFAKIEEYKKTCSAIGFELGTDKFVDCTLKLYVADNKETTQIVQSSSGAQEMIIYDPDRERRIQQKAWNDLLHGRCQLSVLSKNPC